MVNGDIPRAEVERVLEELRAEIRRKQGLVTLNGVDATWGMRDFADKLAALLKPKQYKVEYWVGISRNGGLVMFWRREPSDYDKSNCFAVRHYTDTLEHGEGIE